jgi:fructokinase
VSDPLITVIGEALIDLVPHGQPADYRAHPGGSPFNVAIALARLGHRAALMARIGDHGFGRMLRERAAAEGIDLAAAPHAAEPTTLAVVSMDGPGQATYDFYVEGTADWRWTAAELRKGPTDAEIVHFGSIASWTPPGGERIDRLIQEVRERNAVLVSYDPNVRSTLLGAPVRGRRLIERSVRRAHVVKASREDVAWLYPSRSMDDVAHAWNALGAGLVVVTDGADGATAHRAEADPLRRPGRTITLADTIGAGDAFTAGLLSGLARRNLHAPDRLAAISDAALADVLDEAVLMSSLTCERVGADPPRLAGARAGSTPLTVADFVST